MSIRQTFTDIANAIREKTGNTGLLYPSEMAQNILDIPQGGGEDNLPAFIDGTANFADYASSIRNASAIRPYTFMSDTTVVNANFPKVEKIGEGAFTNCNNLTTVSFPMCTNVGPSAFSYCPKLRDAYFPKATGFSGNTFNYCINLTSIEAPLLESVGAYAFNNCSKLSEANFPLLKAIGNLYDYNAFASTAIKSAYFPLASWVGAYAFENCKSLTTVNLANVMQFGNAVFSGCTSLETVTLGAYSYSSIVSPSNLFKGCTNLKSIYVPSGALNYYQTSSWWSYWSDKIVPYDESDELIYPYEYANNTTITEIPLNKQNVTEVRYNAFLGCTNLKSVNLPNCVSYYENMLSYHLKNIEYLNIGVSWFESFALRDMYSLKEVYAPRLTSIENYTVFYNTKKLRIVSLPLLEMLPAETLKYKAELEYVNLENCKNIIGGGAFSGCSKLEYVNLPNCRSIGNYTFNGCSNLRSVNLDSVEEITQGMFEEVYSLEGINLPACRTFDTFAFGYCYGLKTVSAPNLEYWGASAFTACSLLESVYIGSNVTSVGYSCVRPGGSTKIYVPNDMVDTYKNGVFSSYSSRIFGY